MNQVSGDRPVNGAQHLMHGLAVLLTKTSAAAMLAPGWNRNADHRHGLSAGEAEPGGPGWAEQPDGNTCHDGPAAMAGVLVLSGRMKNGSHRHTFNRSYDP
jgi:hypothetical protein